MNKDISIKSIRKCHSRLIQKYASDQKIAATCSLIHPFPSNGGLNMVKREIESRLVGRRHAFAVYHQKEFAGICTLSGLDPFCETGDLSYWIAVPFWNKGICTEAVKQVIGFSIELGLKNILCEVLSDNYASLRVLEKNGFREMSRIIADNRYIEKFQNRQISQMELRNIYSAKIN